MKIYLDDERPTPDGWHACRWPEEVIELLKAGGVTHLSLDHDLGDDRHGTGYDVILWIEEQVSVGLHAKCWIGRSGRARFSQLINGLQRIRDVGDHQAIFRRLLHK